MTQTIQQRVFPETMTAINAAPLPVYLDTTARKIDYLVKLGLRIMQIDNIQPPSDAEPGAEGFVVVTLAPEK